MPSTRTFLLTAVLIARVAAADDDYYRQQQQQDMYRQQQQQELYRQQQQQQELYRQQQQQQAQQQQALARQQEQQRFERENLERQRVEQARLDQQRERETFRRRQDRDEDERRDENLAIQQRERDEAFQRMQDLRRKQAEWTRQAVPNAPNPAVGARAVPKSCRTVHFKTVGTLEAFSDPEQREVTTVATLVSEAGDGVVGFNVREGNEGHMITRFEASPTSSHVELLYGERCKTKGTDATCDRVYKAVRGSLEFEVLTTASAPRGRLIAHVKGATLVEWEPNRHQATPGGDCVTFEVFNYESTFFPK